MNNQLIELEAILSEELDIFNNIYQLEDEKSEVIIKRDGEILQVLSQKQEENIKRISDLEDRRIDLIWQYIKDQEVKPKDITLKDIASIYGDSAKKVISLGEKLWGILVKIESVLMLNRKLIDDNIEIFNIILNEWRSAISIKSGYNSDGREDEGFSSSMLLNRMG